MLKTQHRNPKRIDKILRLIAQAWELSPDLRFFQLMQGLKSPGKDELDEFYTEDEELEKRLKTLLKSLKKTTNPKDFSL